MPKPLQPEKLFQVLAHHRVDYVLIGGLAATLHVAASFGGSLPVEFPTGELETPFLARPIEAHDGWVEVPQGPGLGVEVNEDAIRRYPYAPAGAQPFLLNR